MIGSRSLREIRDELRSEFAKQGVDFEVWIAELVDRMDEQRPEREKLDASDVELSESVKRHLQQFKTQRAQEADGETLRSLLQFLESARGALEK